MPIVNISLIRGRTAEQRAALISDVTDAVERSIGAPRQTVRVILTEVEPENWGVAGKPRGG